MHDSNESVQQTQGAPRWLLLIHQIPPKPDYLRVKVRRRLHRMGAVALKNSVYVLPRTDEAMEDFQWLRRMVVEDGGEATVCAASFIDGISDSELESMFRTQSDAEYGEIIDAARTSSANLTEADIQRLMRQLEQAAGRDFFHATRGEEAERVVRSLQAGPAVLQGGPASGPRGATWVTRAGVHVDRLASAWLIRRFIDPSARFKFVPARGYHPQPGELRFDMFEGEFTHQGDDCTFEVLVGRFVPDAAALHEIGEIVHDVDCKDEKFGRVEAEGIASVIRGIAGSHADDRARVEAAASLFDGLYADFQRRRR